MFFTCLIVTHAYIFFSGRSSMPYSTPSTLTRMLSYRPIGAHSFGNTLDARSLSTPDRSTSELLRTL